MANAVIASPIVGHTSVSQNLMVARYWATHGYRCGGTLAAPAPVPISTSQVEMFLSIDGGESFSETPFAVVPNTAGYARVTFHLGPTPALRG